MGFPVRTQVTETGTANNLFQQWWLVRAGNRNREHMGLVTPRGRWKLKFCGVSRKIFLRDVVAHQRACSLEFRNKFSGVSSTQKMCLQTQKCWRFDKFTFWESMICKFMCHVCHDVCGVCGEDWQVDRCEEIEDHFVDLHEIPIHPPSHRCPPLWIFQIQTVRWRLVGSSYAWIP